MTKNELIEHIATENDLPKAQAGKVLNSVLDGIRLALGKGETVMLTGFGSFLVSERASRKGRNPQTGAEITIPGGKVPRFKVGKILKEAVK